MTNLLTLEELAGYLRFSRRTIHKLLKEDGIPSVKIGNKWRFDKDAIDRWLHQRTSGVRATILVVDDDSFVTALLEAVLNRLGHRVITAGTGAAGILCLEKHRFDLVFLDLKLPEVDGVEVVRHIRHFSSRLPVVVITGYPDSELMARALAHGPFAIMAKPFGEREIVGILDTFLKVKTQ